MTGEIKKAGERWFNGVAGGWDQIHEMVIDQATTMVLNMMIEMLLDLTVDLTVDMMVDVAMDLKIDIDTTIFCS